MLIPPRITDWIKQAYPKPSVDPAWLEACLTWISDELQLNDVDTQGDDMISNVDTQLLNSDLKDSTLAGTGFPMNIGLAEEARLWGRTLVQIQSIMEIGHSAFSLQNIRQTRVDRADLTGLASDNDEDEDGPVPKYPRSMLRFDLSDGSQILPAIEYRRLPELELGVTPLGYKIVLKDVPIRRGIAFLEPSNVILKGNMTEELDVFRDANLARGFRMRLGQSEPEAATGAEEYQQNVPQSNSSEERTPFRDVPVEELQGRSPQSIPREELEPPSRRRIPASSDSGSSTVVSPYFSNSTEGSSTLCSLYQTRCNRSPVRRTPLPSSRLNQQIGANTDNSSEFDDLEVDDTFLEELNAAEQAAMRATEGSTSQTQNESRTQSYTNTEQSEVIVIDSDSDDKENLSPVAQRRVRRRIESNGHTDIIIID